MQRYNPREIESKWQQSWEDQGIYRATEDATKPKKYVLEFFPYPSGAAMHVGHVRNYTIGDAISRFNRMQGYNVLHPMGWDAFGLPAENYAIKTGISPREAIDQNTERFKRQLQQMGFSHDWSREIDSTDPAYYKWTQWLFLMLYRRGLAYQQESLQWWCPVDMTVLANEQVEAGKCWRCGSDVEKKALKQWFFKITEYADRLAKDLDDVNWTDSIKSMQRNWIGRSKGAEIDFVIADRTYEIKDSLKFTPELTKQVKSGNKTSTFRFEAKNLQKGNFAKLLTRHSRDEVSSFGIAEITGVGQKILRDIPLGYEGHETFSSREEQLQTYRRYYGEAVTLDSVITIYDFQVVAPVVTVFTTRPDTLFGATFMVLAPEHPLVESITTDEQREEVGAYVKAAQAKSDIERQETDREKTGVFTGAYAINPVNGEKIPVWIADYVLSGYGTGAIMAVPAHDERDFAFAQKFDLPIVRVVKNDAADDECTHDEGVMVNSGAYDGMASEEAREKIVADLAARGAGEEKINYKMRDWLISRQRYWGAPIPIIHCPKDGAVAVPDRQLPVVLPDMESFEPSGDGRSPLARVPEFVNTTCPECGGPAERETDTMDGFACSSWYFLRFADPHNNEMAFDRDKADFWLPVDDYIGGAEHAVMHLLYARFWTKVMYDEGLINFQEPFKTLRNQGMILAPDGSKMSKSKGNTIEPDSLIDQGYGADSIRIMELFIGPWDQSAAWSVEGIAGAFRFLQRVWTLTHEYMEAGEEVRLASREVSARLMRSVHTAIKKVSSDMHELSFNTAISALMELVNELYKIKAEHGYSAQEWRFVIESLLKLLAPFAPHMTEELWQQIGQEGSIHTSEWPVHDDSFLVSDTMTIVVQVNGKVRANIEVPADATEDQIVQAAQAEERVQHFIAGKALRKTVYVPKKLVSFVV